jgi:hypothetical protein
MLGALKMHGPRARTTVFRLDGMRLATTVSSALRAAGFPERPRTTFDS